VKTVLLVNDDRAGLVALALILRSHGYGVLESSDADEGLMFAWSTVAQSTCY